MIAIVNITMMNVKLDFVSACKQYQIQKGLRDREATLNLLAKSFERHISTHKNTEQTNTSYSIGTPLTLMEPG